MARDGRPLLGRAALITGASRGIGAALAVRLGQAGADLVLAARNQDDLERSAEASRLPGVNQVLAHTCDVARREDVEGLAQAARSAFGKLDIIINNAGMGRAAPVLESDPADAERMIAVNFWGLYLVTRLCLPLMGAGGDVVNLGSVAGIRPSPGFALYAATKAAVCSFSESLRMELREKDIRVITVNPGMTASHFFDGFTKQGRPPVATGGRELLSPGDVAGAVLDALLQPRNVAINQFTIRPAWQER